MSIIGFCFDELGNGNVVVVERLIKEENELLFMGF